MADKHMVIENDDEGECGLLEIVNEHNEVLGVVLSHTEPRREAPIAEENLSLESETDPNEVPIAKNSSSESETDPNEVPPKTQVQSQKLILLMKCQLPKKTCSQVQSRKVILLIIFLNQVAVKRNKTIFHT